MATGVGLAAFWTTGRRWDVAAVGPVVAVLALYATAALGLDVVTGVAVLVQSHVDSLTAATARCVAELGAALSALLVLVVVRRQARRPVPADGPSDAPVQRGMSVSASSWNSAALLASESVRR